MDDLDVTATVWVDAQPGDEEVLWASFVVTPREGKSLDPSVRIAKLVLESGGERVQTVAPTESRQTSAQLEVNVEAPTEWSVRPSIDAEVVLADADSERTVRLADLPVRRTE